MPSQSSKIINDDHLISIVFSVTGFFSNDAGSILFRLQVRENFSATGNFAILSTNADKNVNTKFDIPCFDFEPNRGEMEVRIECATCWIILSKLNTKMISLP